MSSCWLLGPQQVLAMLLLALLDSQLSVAGAVQRSKSASRLLGPIQMQLTLLMLGMLLPVLLAPQKGQGAPVPLMLPPACLLPPVAESAQRRKQVCMLLAPVRTQQGALLVMPPVCPQLSATVWAWRKAQVMVLQAPAWLLLPVVDSL